jgi:hypothetical protein
MAIKVRSQTVRHACGFAPANAGHDTRALQAYAGTQHPAHDPLGRASADPVQELLEILMPRLRYRSCYEVPGAFLRGGQCRSDLSIPTAPSYQHLRLSIRRHAHEPWTAGLLV